MRIRNIDIADQQCYPETDETQFVEMILKRICIMMIYMTRWNQ